MAAEASSPAAHAAGSTGGRRDGLWLLVTWIVLSIIGCLLVGLVWGPHMPPGAMTDQAAHQRRSVIHGVSQARTARSARGQDGAGCGGRAVPGPPLSAGVA